MLTSLRDLNNEIDDYSSGSEGETFLESDNKKSKSILIKILKYLKNGILIIRKNLIILKDNIKDYLFYTDQTYSPIQLD